jgi:hypothetical protein
MRFHAKGYADGWRPVPDRAFRGTEYISGRQNTRNSLLFSLLQGIYGGDGLAMDCTHRHTAFAVTAARELARVTTS